MITILCLFIVYVANMRDYFSAEGHIMLDNENFPLSLLHFCNLSFQKCCLINHHHAPFTYREIGCCVLTSQSSRFLEHISAESQPLNLNSPCPPGSKIALLSGFHLIKSGSPSHSQGNVYAHPRSCKLYNSMQGENEREWRDQTW